MALACVDLADAHRGVGLAVAELSAIADLGLVLEDDDVRPANVADDLRHHPRARNRRPSDCSLVALADHQNTPEMGGQSDGRFQSLGRSAGLDDRSEALAVGVAQTRGRA